MVKRKKVLWSVRPKWSFLAIRQDTLADPKNCTSPQMHHPHCEAWWWQHHAVGIIIMILNNIDLQNRNWPLAQNVSCGSMKTGWVYCSKSVSQKTFFQHYTCVSYTSI